MITENLIKYSCTSWDGIPFKWKLCQEVEYRDNKGNRVDKQA